MAMRSSKRSASVEPGSPKSGMHLVVLRVRPGFHYRALKNRLPPRLREGLVQDLRRKIRKIADEFSYDYEGPHDDGGAHEGLAAKPSQRARGSASGKSTESADPLATERDDHDMIVDEVYRLLSEKRKSRTRASAPKFEIVDGGFSEEECTPCGPNKWCGAKSLAVLNADGSPYTIKAEYAANGGKSGDACCIEVPLILSARWETRHPE